MRAEIGCCVAPAQMRVASCVLLRGLVSNGSGGSIADNGAALIQSHLAEGRISLKDSLLPKAERALLDLIARCELLDRLQKVERDVIRGLEEAKLLCAREDPRRQSF